MFNFFKKNSSNDASNSAKTPEKNILSSFKSAVQKTSDALVKNILNIAASSDKIDDFLLDDIESALIKADVGIDLAVDIVDTIRAKKIKSDELGRLLKAEFENILESAGSNVLKFDPNKLNIYFVVGINGAGKTTLIGKLAYKMKQEGKKVLLAAGDTFRAAAEEQLEIWAKRAGVEIVREDGIDPAAVVYKAIDHAAENGCNALIIDTAGRLQNKFNLIEELKKIKSVADKKAPDANFESLLVLDASLGQNGLNQAKVFKEAVNLTAVALTKLDGSSKGGIIFSVARDYGIPVKLVGIGEKITDIKDFDRKEFIDTIFMP